MSDLHAHITPRRTYVVLDYAQKVSRLFQLKNPFAVKDAGVHRISRYEWYIYEEST